PEDSKILSHMVENLRRCPPDFLYPVVIGSDAVDKVQGVCGAVAVQDLHIAGWFKLFGACPVGSFFLHLAVRVATTFKSLQGFLQTLRDIPFVDHASAQVDDLVDILDQQGAFFLTRATRRAGPDFILRKDASNQRTAFARTAEHGIMLETVISRFNRDQFWR